MSGWHKSESFHAWKKKNRKRYMLYSAKERATKSGIEFSLTADDIIIPAVCPILLVPLEHGEGRAQLNSPSLDRIDNSKGYIPGNVAVISNRANDKKGNLTLEEVERLYLYMKGELIG